VKKAQQHIDVNKIKKLINEWLNKRIEEDAVKWINSTAENLKNNAEDWEFFSSFSAVPRHTGKDKLELTEEERQKASEVRTGWDLSEWTLDQLGRTFLLLSIAGRDKIEFLEKLEKLFISSDMSEAIALYQSLPVLPYPNELKERAAEGIRSNITTVFNAVALRNPYPADYLDEGAWNQLVLKALFVGSPLYLIQGIDRRSNKKLAEMLVEYAHERWSAGREVSPELWRPVEHFLNEDSIKDVEKVLNHPDDIQKKAAVLALSASAHEAVEELIKEYQKLVNTVKDEHITWQGIGKQYHDH